MKSCTRAIIKAAMESDDTITTAERKRINEALNGDADASTKACRFGPVKEAAQILNCHPKTAERYAIDGKIKRVHLSCRRVRYNLDDCQRLATEGLK